MELNEKQRQLCANKPWDFSNLGALFLNCTLKRSPEVSHTEGLMQISRTIMEKTGFTTEPLRPVDHATAHGVYPDMTAHGCETDIWPALFEKVIPVVASITRIRSTADLPRRVRQ